MRKQHNILFMGNGSVSADHCSKLEGRLRETFSILSGAQQPPHSRSEEEAEFAEKEYKKDIQNIEDFVRDIAMAFTGYEIDFKKDPELDKKKEAGIKALEFAIHAGDQHVKCLHGFDNCWSHEVKDELCAMIRKIKGINEGEYQKYSMSLEAERQFRKSHPDFSDEQIKSMLQKRDLLTCRTEKHRQEYEYERDL